ncbi:hypothetical protein [Ideonella sp. A 288]|uniref:hypothetical protein n=1 Tax=Ideonella sp. A 288 TaxID=1962181 RepID=UPI000B4C141D|nr:hypothetical protein [Ideonella sp. A 288]
MTPTPFLALLLLPWIWRDPSWALALAIVSCAFGATAAAHLGSGSPLLLSVVAMLPVMWHAWAPRLRGWLVPAGRVAAPSASPAAGADRTLLALLVWAGLLTVFAPRLLAGTTEVIAIVSMGLRNATRLVPLAPQAGNFNQLAYLVFGGLCFMAVARLLRQGVQLRQVADALLLVSAVNLLAALLQGLHLYAGAPNLLAPFANAGYAIHLGGEVGGLNRLSGAFPESSAFAVFTLALHAVCRALARGGHRPALSATLAVGLLMALLLSTSSTAFGGLALLYALYAASAGVRLLQAPRELRLGRGALLALLAACAVVAALLLWPPLLDGVVRMVQTTLWTKLDSASGQERSFWNRQAWLAFTDTWGLGVGVGSTRASSYPLVLLSNLGVIGTLLFVGFVAQTGGRALVAPRPPAACAAAAHGMLALLCAATVSASVLDLGVLFYLLAGVTTRVVLAPAFAPAWRPGGSVRPAWGAGRPRDGTPGGRWDPIGPGAGVHHGR